MAIHPVYKFLDVSTTGQVTLLPNDPNDNKQGPKVLSVSMNTYDQPLIQVGGYRWYLADLMADIYLELPEGYSRHMLRPVWKNTASMGKWTVDDLKWSNLATIDSGGEIHWNPIPVYLIDITKILSDKAVFLFNSKAKLKRYLRDEGVNDFTFSYTPDSYFKLRLGKYITLRQGIDDPTDHRLISAKHWYLLKKQDNRYVYHRAIRQTDLLDEIRHSEGFDKTLMRSVFMRHNIDTERGDFTVINNDYAICRAEDYVTRYHVEYNKHCQETMGDIPF